MALGRPQKRNYGASAALYISTGIFQPLGLENHLLRENGRPPIFQLHTGSRGWVQQEEVALDAGEIPVSSDHGGGHRQPVAGAPPGGSQAPKRPGQQLFLLPHPVVLRGVGPSLGQCPSQGLVRNLQIPRDRGLPALLTLRVEKAPSFPLRR